MRVLIALDKFKDAITAIEACETVAAALLEVNSSIDRDCCPLTDGGEGFAEILTVAAGGYLARVDVNDARGRRVAASIGYVRAGDVPARARRRLDLPMLAASDKIAIVDMASASGLALLPHARRDPWQASSFGTGEAMRQAAESGSRAILLGVGGSATHDLGLGALAALGWAFCSTDGREIEFPTPSTWPRLGAIKIPAGEALPPIRIACDVLNPLLGDRGAVSVRAAPAPAATGAVKQWDRFEHALENTRTYADPYRDVTLAVAFTRPDGGTIPFWGFYDGGRTWRFRFMPDQVGTWKYSAVFSDCALGASGTFTCVESDLPGMLGAHAANPMWFGYQQGEAALIRGLHIGDRFFAKNWDDAANPNDGEKRTAFLNWLQEQGYNLLSIGSHYVNRSAPGRGAGWETPRLWPLDAAEYRRMESILDDLARRKIMVFPFAGFFGRDGNFPQDTAGQELYVKYTYARVGVYWNALLNVAGPEPMLRGKPFFELPELRRIGHLIQGANVFRKPLSVHNRTGNDEYRDEAWTNYGILQGSKTSRCGTNGAACGLNPEGGFACFSPGVRTAAIPKATVSPGRVAAGAAWRRCRWPPRSRSNKFYKNETPRSRSDSPAHPRAWVVRASYVGAPVRAARNRIQRDGCPCKPVCPGNG